MAEWSRRGIRSLTLLVFLANLVVPFSPISAAAVSNPPPGNVSSHQTTRASPGVTGIVPTRSLAQITAPPWTWSFGGISLVATPPANVDFMPVGTTYQYTVDVTNEEHGYLDPLVLIAANSPDTPVTTDSFSIWQTWAITMSGTITLNDVATGYLHIPDPGITVSDGTTVLGSTGAFAFPFTPPAVRTDLTLEPVTIIPATCDDGSYAPPSLAIPESGEITYWLEPDPDEFAPGDELVAYASWDPDLYAVSSDGYWILADDPGYASQAVHLDGCARTGLLVELVPDRTSYSLPTETIGFSVFARNIGEASLFGITVNTGVILTSSLLPGERALIATGAHPVSMPDITTGTIALAVTVTGIDAISLDPVGATAQATLDYSPPAPVTLDAIPEWNEASCNGMTPIPPTITLPVDETDTISFIADPPGVNGNWAPGQVVTIVATVADGRVFGDRANGWEIDPDDDSRATFTISLNNVDCVVAAISLDISIVDEQPAYAAGETVFYTLIATNTGNTDLSDVAVTDDLVDDLVCDGNGISSGKIITCTAHYTVTQQDIDGGGSIVNAASVIGTAADGTTQPSDTASIDANLVERAPKLSLGHAVDPAIVDVAGQEVTYTFTVTNSGNVTITDIAIDALQLTTAGRTITCGKTSLAPGNNTDCTATLAFDQDALDTGSPVEIVVTATGTAPGGGTVSSNSITASVTFAREPEISLAARVTHVTSAGVVRELADGETATGLETGDIVTYGITVTNTGNLTLHDAVIEDTMLGTLQCAGSLSPAPGDTITCSGTYTLVAADETRWRGIVNTPSVVASPPVSGLVTASDSVTIWPSVPKPSLQLDLEADRGSYSAPGDTIQYTVTVENTGLVPIDGVQFSTTGMTIGNDCAFPEMLDPGDSVTCTSIYTLVQDDLDGGTHTGGASISGVGPDTTPVTIEDAVAATAVQNPVLGFTVEVRSVNDTPVTGAATGLVIGDVVTYALIAANTGNVTLAGVEINDSLVTEDLDCEQPASLAPGSSLTCMGAWTITQDDVDQGFVTSDATATATAPGKIPLAKTASITIMTVEAAPGIALSLSAAPNPARSAGEVVVWSFVITNTGNVTVTDIAIQSDRFDAGHISCPKTTILPNESITCTASIVITQDHIDYGDALTHEATATGLAVRTGGGTVRKSSDDPRLVATSPTSATVQILQEPALTLVMSGAISAPDAIVPGTMVTWEFLVTNSGNTTLRDVLVDDELVIYVAGGGSGFQEGLGTMVPGQSATLRGTSRITPTQLAARSITNRAMAGSGALRSPESVFTLSLGDPAPTPTPTNPAAPTPTPAPTGSVIPPTPTPTSPATPTVSPSPTTAPEVPNPADPDRMPTGDGTGGQQDATPDDQDPAITGLPSTGQAIPGIARPTWITALLATLVLVITALGVRRHGRV
ncbi:MAG TPA: hypothetical protein VNZ58_00455 [Thermomicrobiales bacterium]|nr:hypothetical protein [Thermomicrobiales bacterium]